MYKRKVWDLVNDLTIGEIDMRGDFTICLTKYILFRKATKCLCFGRQGDPDPKIVPLVLADILHSFESVLLIHKIGLIR